MLKSHQLLRSWRLTHNTASSSQCAAPPQFQYREKQRGENDKDGRDYGRQKSYYSWSWARRGVGVSAPLLAVSYLATIKDWVGLKPLNIKLDDDPLAAKVKESWLHRKYGRFQEAVEILLLAVEEAKTLENKNAAPLTRVYSELANTYHQMGDYQAAEENFKLVISRMMRLHGLRDVDMEIILCSLKLADAMARRGDSENAELGFKHCVRKQLKVMETHLQDYHVSAGANIEVMDKVGTYGDKYTGPIALYGYCLQCYSNYLVEFGEEERFVEACEYMDEAMKISFQIHGASSYQSIVLCNNFGTALINRNRFDLALKYLEIGAQRIEHVPEAAQMLPGYLCNYAEALFHTGKKEQALKAARKGLEMSKDSPPQLQNYVRQYVKDLERDANKGKGGGWWLW